MLTKFDPLSGTDPDHCLRLAEELHNLAFRLDAADHSDEARAAAHEAIAGYRQSAALGQTRVEWLAANLTILNKLLSALADLPGAVEAQQAAVDMLRTPVSSDPVGARRILLADALFTLTARLVDVQRRTDAGATADESIDTYADVLATVRTELNSRAASLLAIADGLSAGGLPDLAAQARQVAAAALSQESGVEVPRIATPGSTVAQVNQAVSTAITVADLTTRRRNGLAALHDLGSLVTGDDFAPQAKHAEAVLFHASGAFDPTVPSQLVVGAPLPGFFNPDHPQPLLAKAVAAEAIKAKYAALDGAPGDAVGGVEASNGGFVQRYLSSAIYWKAGIGAFWVLGAIYQEYVVQPALGFPTTDETSTSDGVGRFSHFEHGSISWHPATGAHAIAGAIYDCWNGLGAETFGYPVSDEDVLSVRIGRSQQFVQLGPTATVFGPAGSGAENSIYWSPETGAFAVLGPIRTRWMELGADKSYLGLPVTEERDITDADRGLPGRISHFERGAIEWIALDGSVVEFPARRVFRSSHFGVSAVGGEVQLTLTSAGTFEYRGHFHNSGLIGLSYTVASALKLHGTTTALGASHSGTTHGSLSVGSRDDDWHDEGYYDNSLGLGWDSVLNAEAMRSTIQVGVAGGDVLLLGFLPILGAAIVISLVAGAPPGPPDTVCKETEGHHAVTDGNNNTVWEADGVRCRRPGS